MIIEFKNQINNIVDNNIKQAVFEMLKYAPKYFWNTPASTTGKYHPLWALGKHGLQKHVAFAMYVTQELSRTYNLSQKETDISLAAIAMHDTLKYGVKKDIDYDYFLVHPYIVRSYYSDFKKRPELKKYLQPLIDNGEFNSIMKCVEKHMGSIVNGDWNPMMLVPENNMEIVVHLADFISSRKEISFTQFIDNE